MRWIVCCVLALGFGLGIGVAMIGHFASKSSNPNLVELGLAENLDELAAPGDPEPARENEPVAVRGAPTNDVIDLFAKPLNPAGGQSALPIDSEIRPTSYVDTAGVIELDNLAHQWMPLCRASETGPTGAPVQGRESGPDRMPRCEDTLVPRLPERP